MSSDPVAHRRGEAVVVVVGRDGGPLPHTEVTVQQTRHAFAFGNIGFDLVPLAAGEQGAPAESTFGGAAGGLERLAELWLGIFNTATLPFYWRGFEPEQGQPQTERLRAAAEWFRARGVAVKGHPLVWHTLAPEWLAGRDERDIERMVRQRVARDVSDFAGLIDTWDAINEVVIMPDFDREDNAVTQLAQSLGRVGMVRLAFDEARAANPNATLLLNDFDLSERFEHLIEDVLEAGVHLDAIGLQTHMHQGYRGEDWMLGTLDRFARFGIPLHLTESTLLSGELMPPHIEDLNDWQVDSWPSTPEGEERQAQELERHYRSLVGHPSVEAITYWGLTDDGAWLGAPVGLVRSDRTTKPSYDALRALITDEWWLAPTTMHTDDAGRLFVRGFRGDYELLANGETQTFTIS